MGCRQLAKHDSPRFSVHARIQHSQNAPQQKHSVIVRGRQSAHAQAFFTKNILKKVFRYGYLKYIIRSGAKSMLAFIYGKFPNICYFPCSIINLFLIQIMAVIPRKRVRTVYYLHTQGCLNSFHMCSTVIFMICV